MQPNLTTPSDNVEPLPYSDSEIVALLEEVPAFNIDGVG